MRKVYTHTSQTDVLDRDITPLIKDVNAFFLKKNSKYLGSQTP